MHWTLVAEIISDALALILIFRLLSLRLHSVYGVFCLFLVFEIAMSLATLAETHLYGAFDYRTIWACSRVVSWVLSIWIIYRLLGAILANYPALQAFSRKIFGCAIVLAIVVGFLTGIPEYSSRISGMVGFVLVLDRVISTTALILLIAVLGFILWFPVKMPRNLAVFSIGFAVYFTAKTTFLLALSFWSHESLRLVSNAIVLVLSGCYLCWTILLTPQGKVASVQIGHSWRPADREHLLLQLEAVNASLLRTARGSAS